jgi:SAM-dependent methyltransferase
VNRLGDSFRHVAADYDRGRPRYPPDAVAAMLAGLPEPADVVDIGAGTGQLSLALADAGARVVAVEPGAETRRLLEQRVGDGVRVLDARAEELPLDDSSVDLVVCADSFHWLDAELAAAEFRRVLRPGGRVSLSTLMPSWTPEESAGWADETGAILGPLYERAKHPLVRTGFRVPELPPGSGFEGPAAIDIPFRFATDRDGLLALFGSWSVVAALPDAERAELRERLREALDRHGVGQLELTFTAQLRLYSARCAL